MKKLLNLTLFFSALALLLLLNFNILHTETINSINCIQNAEKESVVLISNNLLNGELSSRQENNNQNFSGTSPFILPHSSIDNFFNRNKISLNSNFIVNLSIDKQKAHQIRAP